MKPWSIFIIMAVVSLTGFGQGNGGTLTTTNKRAEKFFSDALQSYDNRNYAQSLAALQKATEADPDFIEAWILTGDLYSEQNLNKDAKEAYQKAVEINPNFAPRLFFILGNVSLADGQYGEALGYFQRYLQDPRLTDKQRDQVIRAIHTCEFGKYATEHPVPFKPVNMGEHINTEYHEYVNTITADSRRFFFTRAIPREVPDQWGRITFQEEFFAAEANDSSWNKALNLGPPINTGGNEGGLFMSPDGRFLFFAACDRPDGKGSCDIYWSRKEGEVWTTPVNLGSVVNSGDWDSQPSFSSDGRTLYFASKRSGGKGSSDIWKAVLYDDYTWSEPVNLGDSINTGREEMAPFIHPDDQTLYFSSKGHMGMGGFDLFYSKRDVTGRWTRPVNLGYPINTHSDEITLLVNSRGNLAYISSDKYGGFGRQDIYEFELYRDAQPVEVIYFRGIVYDKETKKRLEARFELIDLQTGNIVAKSSSDPLNGSFLLILPLNKDYALNVSKDGYLFYSDNFSLAKQGQSLDPIEKSIPLQPIKVGETVILKNIFFDTDKYVLKPESRAELERLTTLLKKNPQIRIEISGHTDIVGTPEYNIELSRNRAKAVYDYLTSQDIAADRMTYAGYGLTRPIDTNETEEGRANNRRTEFRIVSQ